MIIRVDDFPHGIENCTTPPKGHWDRLAEFASALRGPFLLGALSGPLTAEEFYRLAGHIPGMSVGYHGHFHTRGDGKMRPHLIAARAMLGPSATFIPPFNHLDAEIVAAVQDVGFRFVCTGPETNPAVDFGRLIEIKPAFYGKAKDFLAAPKKLGEFDCVALHLTWEHAEDKFKSLAEFGKLYADQMVPWENFFVTYEPGPSTAVTAWDTHAKLVKHLGPMVEAMSCVQGGLISEMDRNGKRYKCILEIGTFRGVSACVFAHYAERVITVDCEARKEVSRVLREAGMINRVVPIVVANNAAKTAVIDQLNFDMAFIDGGHTRLQVEIDFNLTKRCGEVLFHDYPNSGSLCDGPGWLLDTVKPPGRIERRKPFAWWRADPPLAHGSQA